MHLTRDGALSAPGRAVSPRSAEPPRCGGSAQRGEQPRTGGEQQCPTQRYAPFGLRSAIMIPLPSGEGSSTMPTPARVAAMRETNRPPPEPGQKCFRARLRACQKMLSPASAPGRDMTVAKNTLLHKRVVAPSKSTVSLSSTAVRICYSTHFIGEKHTPSQESRGEFDCQTIVSAMTPCEGVCFLGDRYVYNVFHQ